MTLGLRDAYRVQRLLAEMSVCKQCGKRARGFTDLQTGKVNDTGACECPTTEGAQ